MLSALSLIPGIVQIDVNLLKCIVEGLVVHFWVTFTKEVSLLCLIGTSVGCREFYILRAVQVPTFSTISHSAPRGSKLPHLDVTPKCNREWRQQTKH